MAKFLDLMLKFVFVVWVLGLLSFIVFFISGFFSPKTAAAEEYTELKIYPENVGVFWASPPQQFVAFGTLPDGTKVNLTQEVDWYVEGENAEQKVRIDQNGLATALKPSGQVKVTACYPKPCKPSSTAVLAPVISYILLAERTTDQMWSFIYSLPSDYQDLWFGSDSNAVIYQSWKEMRGLR